MPGGYAYDNDVDVALQQHACLSAMLDDFTRSRLSTVSPSTGAFRCLEIGAGAGSVARWLAARGASVVATDLKPRHVPAGPGIRVLAHDIAAEPVPDPPYDLIHARLVLMHLREREEVLHRLAAALRPGGWLAVEDWYVHPEHLVLDAPDPGDVTLFQRYQRALLGAIGSDPTWATRIHARMVAAGLREVDTAVHSPVWPAGSPGALLATVNLTHFHAPLLAAGLTAAELDHLRWLVTDPRSGLVVRGHLLYSTVARAPH